MANNPSSCSLCYVRLTLIMLLSASTYQSARVCPSEDWKVDISHSRCLRLSQSDLDYKSAARSCEDRGSRLFVPQTQGELSELMDVLGSMNESVYLWSGHIILSQDSRFRVYDDRGVDVSQCSICPSLIRGLVGLPVTEGAQFCPRISMPTMNWTISDCSTQHYFMCHYSLKDSTEGQLQARDIAAIGVAVFILVCFFLTLTIDFYLHIQKEKKVYVDDTRSESDKSPDRVGPSEIVTHDFGSKTDLIPPSPILCQA